MKPHRARWLVVALLVLQAPAWAADPSGDPSADAAERARIAAERQAVEARFEAARRDCETRFAVTDCLNRARQARREALEPLREQQHLLDDARRRQNAVERLRAIQAQESAAAARPALGAPAPDLPASAHAHPPAPPRRAVRPAVPASAADAQARARAAEYEKRLQEAQAHEEAVKARNARRDARRPPAPGLPVPALPASAP